MEPAQSRRPRFFEAPWHPAFKLAIFLLLVANAGIFLVEGTPSEGLDSAAWLTLLLLFELETAHAARLSAGALLAVHGARLAAGAAVIVAAAGYVQEQAWLEAINAWLWIAVVIVLEIQVRFGARRQRPVGTALAAVLYLGLALMALLWGWRGEWFDAYDAALWLVAFATIEMNVLRR